MKRILFFLALAACHEEAVEPAPAPAVPTTTATTPPEKKPVKRTVETRVPFGGPAGNLLVDGDFEVSISFEGSGEQLAWIALTETGGEAYLRGETGGLCKSGLSCGVLEPGMLLYGRGTSAKDAAMDASIYMKPPAGRGCDIADIELVHCNFSGTAAALTATSADPAADGWCQYTASIEPQSQGICMLITSELAQGETALVDRATLLAAGRSSQMSKMTLLPGTRRAELARLSDVLRNRMPF